MTISWWTLIYELFGGLALFLFGMDVMTNALKISAGDQLKAFLYKMTSTKWRAMLAGCGITALIQSSSVTTVLAVGFVAAGAMTFQSTLGVILGANIGTTITAQIIAFKVTKIALLIIIVGYLFTLISENKKYKEYGRILLGLGLIFLGMNVMSEGMSPLKEYAPFLDLMHNLDNPIYGILIGAFFTALVQSSSATTGIVIILSTQGFISTEAGISLIIGANIGTCVTAFLSAIGKPVAAMQVAVAHITFKVIGSLLWVAFIPQLADIVNLITPRDLPRQIANAHTIFNVANAGLLIGFTGPIAKLIMKFLPDNSSERSEQLPLLDNYYLENTSLAIDLVQKEIISLAKQTIQLIENGLSVAISGSKIELDELRQKDSKVDDKHRIILSYLQQIQQKQLSTKETITLKNQIELSNILEASADLITTNLVESASHRIENDFKVSTESKELFERLYQKSVTAISDSITAFEQNDASIANKVIEEKGDFRELQIQLKDHLATRLSVDDKHRIEIIRFESEIIEITGGLYSNAKRIAKLLKSSY